jgi:predicted RNA-binding protein with PUA-like domain
MAEVSKTAYPDATQFDKKSEYHDAGSRRDDPRWLTVDLKFVRKTRLISLRELHKHKPLARMRVLQRGNRLSITPVEPAEWKFIMGLVKE